MHQFTLGKYKDLNIQGPPMFQEKEVERAVLESVLNAANTWSKMHDPIQKGDRISIEIEGVLDGLPVPEISNSHLSYTVGDPSMMPQFECVIGKKLNDTFSMDIHFPEKAPVERIANRTVHFEGKIKEVTHKTPPQINDAIAHQIDPTVQSVEELKKKFDSIVRSNGLDTLHDQRAELVLNAIIEDCSCIYDEAEFQTLYDQIYLQTRAMLVQSKLLNIEKSMDDLGLKNDCKEMTERTIKEDLAIQAIAKKEQITISAEELENNKKKFTQTPAEQEEFQKYFPTDEAFAQFLLKEKVIDQLIQWNINNLPS